MNEYIRSSTACIKCINAAGLKREVGLLSAKALIWFGRWAKDFAMCTNLWHLVAWFEDRNYEIVQHGRRCHSNANKARIQRTWPLCCQVWLFRHSRSLHAPNPLQNWCPRQLPPVHMSLVACKQDELNIDHSNYQLIFIINIIWIMRLLTIFEPSDDYS